MTVGQLPKSRGSYNSYRSLCNKLLHHTHTISRLPWVRNPGTALLGSLLWHVSRGYKARCRPGQTPSQGPAGAGCASKFTQRCLAGSGGPVPCRLVDEATPLPAGLLHRSKFTSRQRTSMADGSLWSSNQRSETLHACRILFMRSPQVRLTLTGR